ncbi:hypothetical protein, partial [Microvirga tunisiensis]|uniref:hypothetical protein n=1 Tax=Microvirga tunisiensis TaxID=2108360 RepID=UPI001AED66B3
GLAIARNMLPAWIADCFPEVVPWPALPAASGRSFNWLYIAFDRGCVKTQTALISTNYLYKFTLLYRRFLGLSGLIGN